MQHNQQQQAGGGGGPQFLGGYGQPQSGGAAAARVVSDEDQKLGDLGIAEAASPISSRPPATNFEEMIQATAEAGGSSSNRWPRQETLALLQIRSEMDIAFRDATLKGPLWEQVSRKLGELGYKRSAKKCKEKFENVHKYYKRTKEGRGGRQDGKSYKFFAQLEALHRNITTAAAAPPQPVVSLPQTDHSGAALFGNVGISFSSDDDEDDDDDDDMDMDVELGDNRHERKRKRSDGEGEERMMDFFEGLLKQVMQKQEAMQQRFLEAIEKREQDRMIREEAWKRQDMARIAREHDIMAQERSISASRDAAIIDFLQKITGQTIQLPTTTTVQPQEQLIKQPERQNQRGDPPHESITEGGRSSCDIVGEDVGAGGVSNMETTSSSRWPKAEVLALIKLRSGMEARYQEAGPKGPLWEDISAGMQQMGYNRSSKRCKEKWENINKYFKKVKESNKKRPQDAKTCPYFNELDALYRNKLIVGTSAAEKQQQSDAHGAKPDDQLNIGGEKQPEDMLNKGHRPIADNYCNVNSDDLDEDYEDEVDENDDKTEEEIKMVYKIQFQRQNVGSSNAAGTAAPSSFIAMVQ